MFETAMPLPVCEKTLDGQQTTLRFAGTGLWHLPRAFWQVLTLAACSYGAYLTWQLCSHYGPGSFLPATIISLVFGPGVIYWMLTFLGRAPAEVALVCRELRVQETKVFYVRRRTWRAEEILSIEMGDSPEGCGEDCPLPELQIRLLNGKTFGLLRGRTPQVLEQTAECLRDGLNIPCLATVAVRP